MLTSLDESLLHQAALSFAATVTTDHRFYDRCWVAAYDPVGGTALNMGLGIYKNMNVADGFLCVVRGDQQRNLRVARQLRPDVDESKVGPLEYRVLDPYRHLRVTLESGEHEIACRLDWKAAFTPFVECATRTEIDGRLVTDVQRYDQVGRVDGWLEVAGEHVEVAGWFGARDHSWGVRGGVGGFEPVTGTSPPEGFLVTWLLFSTDDVAGYVQLNRDGAGNETFRDGALRWRDGRPDRSLIDVTQEIEFPPASRDYHSARMELVDSEGEQHVVVCERLSKPIVMRGAGYDGGYQDGRGLGVHRGPAHLEFDAYDLSHEGSPVVATTGENVDGLQREQPVRVAFDDSPGIGDFTVIAIGDLTRLGVAPRSGGGV